MVILLSAILILGLLFIESAAEKEHKYTIYEGHHRNGIIEVPLLRFNKTTITIYLKPLSHFSITI